MPAQPSHDESRFAPPTDSPPEELPLPPQLEAVSDWDESEDETQPAHASAYESWESYQSIARDRKERHKSTLRALKSRAELTAIYQHRARRYRHARTIMWIFWTGYIATYVILAAIQLTTEPSAFLGALLWFATMFAAAAGFISWHIMRQLNPGKLPYIPLPDNIERHKQFADPKKPAWDRRIT